MKRILKTLYQIIPFKRDFYRILKKLWTPPKAIYKHLHFNGIITIRIDENHDFRLRHFGYQIENEVFWKGLTGGWEKISMGLWIKLCKNAKVIFDIGANTGLCSLVAKSINPESRIYAFEPVKRIVEKLKFNVELNKYDINIIDKAASNSDGIATIYDPQTEHLYSVTVNKNLSSPDIKVTPVKIETVKLSSFIKGNKVDRIDLMKIDVETHEPEVLEGLGEYIDMFRPTLLIEILTDEVGQKVEDKLANLNYLYFNIDEEKGIRQVNNILKSDYFNYLICPEKVAKELKIIKTAANVAQISNSQNANQGK